MQKINQGRYIATDVRWGMVLDLSSVEDQSLIASGFHGQENQQARALVSSFTRRRREELIVSRDPWVRPTTACLSVVGVQSLQWGFRHQQRQARRVPRSPRLEGTGSGRSRGSRHRGFPECWGLEIMDNGNRIAENGAENGDGGVYVRYV